MLPFVFEMVIRVVIEQINVICFEKARNKDAK